MFVNSEQFAQTGIDPGEDSVFDQSDAQRAVVENRALNMGKFLKWVGQDTQKEEMDTVTANGLEWSDVVKPITAKAKKFFMEKANEF